MKKILNMILIVVAVAVFSPMTVNAAELNTVLITINNPNLEPGENVITNIQFGQKMGSYTVEVAYDKNLFEYVSVIGGQAEDLGNKVRVLYDKNEAEELSDMAVVLFKTKEEIITAVPTNFSTTITNLKNEDFSVTYDDILIPTVNEITINPNFEPYNIDMVYEGKIKPEEEKEIKLNISSSLGENFNQARIVAEAVTPEGAVVKLLGIDKDNEEFDLIQNGYGDPSGDQLGGIDILKQLDLRGVFSKEGDYEIYVSLINREKADGVIASQTFNIVVANEEEIEDEKVEEIEEVEEDENVLEIPEELPKAGNTNYLAITLSLVILFSIYLSFKFKQKNK